MSSDLFLCLDTATPTARVAVLDGAGSVRFSAEATAERHSSHVLPLCAEALRAVAIAPADLAGIACGGGPGSFTGLRVGLSTVKGLALPTGVPLYVVSSLHALALDILGAGGGNAITAVPCLDAGKGEVYVGGYVADAAALVRETAADCRIAAGALADWLAALPPPAPVVAGNGAERHAGRRPRRRRGSDRRLRGSPGPAAARARRGGEPRQRRPDLRPPARHHRQEGEAARVMTADR